MSHEEKFGNMELYMFLADKHLREKERLLSKKAQILRRLAENRQRRDFLLSVEASSRPKIGDSETPSSFKNRNDFKKTVSDGIVAMDDKERVLQNDLTSLDSLIQKEEKGELSMRKLVERCIKHADDVQRKAEKRADDFSKRRESMFGNDEYHFGGISSQDNDN